MNKIVKVNTGSKLEESASYSRLVMVDNWIYVSNTAGRNPDTKKNPESIIEQTQQVFDNIERALAAGDATLADVVMSRVFIQNPAETHTVTQFIETKFRGVNPATTVTNPPLGSAECKVELEVTAYRGVGSAQVEEVLISV